VGSDTIRYYEKIGLLLPPERTPAGYRIYDAAVVGRLQFIQGAQRLGLTLLDIKNLLAIRDTGECPCEPAETLLRRRMAELDAELARLTALRDQIVAMVEALPAADCPRPRQAAGAHPMKGGDCAMSSTMLKRHLVCCDCDCDDPSCPCRC
jgi:DNA-binding transcriptional MerR regulator